ncbi:hypothetical protein GGS20DRAFT_425811 [Poronia punctata]|nr:hypothetical protein GGS20DRAFT_425811 [Poronia punctata]
MRFTSFVAAGLFAIAANAQSSTTQAPATTVSVDPAQSSAVDEITECLAACDESDTVCRAHCIAVPSPDSQNVNETTTCVANCDQGSGSAADNAAYGDCVSNCIGQFYFTNTGTPDLATSSKAGSNTENGGSSVTQVPTTITSGGSTYTTHVPSTTGGSSNSDDDAPPTSSSSAAAATMYPHAGTIGTGLGFVGLLAGVFAL